MFTALCLIGFFALYEAILRHINCGNKVAPEIETDSNTNNGETNQQTKKTTILFSFIMSYLKHFSFVLLQGILIQKCDVKLRKKNENDL